MSHTCRTIHFLWGTESLSNHEKCQYYYWVCPSGIVQWPPDPDRALYAVPGDLPADISGEHSDDPDHQGWFSAPHTHVLLPRTPVFPGSQFLLSHCAQNAKELLVSEEKHFSVGLHHPEFLFHSLRGDRSLSSLRHGLRPLCCYLPPSGLHCGHEQASLHWDCEHSLGSGIFYFLDE